MYYIPPAIKPTAVQSTIVATIIILLFLKLLQANHNNPHLVRLVERARN